MTQTAPPKHTSDSGANGHSESTAEALDKCLAGASSLLSAAFTLDTIEGSAQRRFFPQKVGVSCQFEGICASDLIALS